MHIVNIVIAVIIKSNKRVVEKAQPGVEGSRTGRAIKKVGEALRLFMRFLII